MCVCMCMCVCVYIYIYIYIYIYEAGPLAAVELVPEDVAHPLETHVRVLVEASN